MQELVDCPNLLLYGILLKFAFRFCPPFVHEKWGFYGQITIFTKSLSDGRCYEITVFKIYATPLLLVSLSNKPLEKEG